MSKEIHKKVYWRLLLNTSNPSKAQKVAKQVVKVLGNYFISQLEPYWKDSTMYDLQFDTDLSGIDIQNVVFELITTISLLSSNWKIFVEDCRVDNYRLSGVTDQNIAIVGVRWASFMMC